MKLATMTNEEKENEKEKDSKDYVNHTYESISGAKG